ncbi:MAG: secretin N-terminal domain-containing protein, partial [Planctomycetota bacterium]
MLQIWGSRLGTLVVADQSLTGVKIRFLQSDVTLTWGLFKKLLDFHQVVIEERQANGRWILYATRKGPSLQISQSTSTPILQPGDAIPQREEIVTAILQVTHGTAADIYQNLRQIQAVREQNRVGSMLYVRGPEVIVIVDFASSVEYYTRLVRALDVRAPGQVTRVLHVTFAPVEDVVQVLGGLLRGPTHGAGVPVIGGSGQAPPNIIPDSRTNKLFVQCYADQLEEIQWIVNELDVKARTKETTRHFYSCRYADALYLAQKLSEIFVTASGSSASPARRTASKSAKPAASPAPVSVTPPPGAPPRDLSAIETRIVADERSNALIITADDVAYREILEVLQGANGRPGLDRAARRIAIEVQVWEISTPNDTLALGIELEGAQSPKRGEFRPAAATSFGLSQTTFDAATNRLSRVPALAASGLLAGFTKDRFDRFPIILQAIASLEKTRLVTTPFAVTNDNEEVKF